MSAAAIKKTSATRWNSRAVRRSARCRRQRRAGKRSRKILTEPIGCLFLAGEATHETLWGTVDGAWESGERAADAALHRIGALKEPEPIEAPERPRPRRRGARTASPLD